MSEKTATPTGTANDPIPVSQITQKCLDIDPKNVRKMPEGSMIKLGVFFGVIQGIKYKENNFNGELNACFIGDFRIIHPVTGKVYTGEKAYFFKALSEKLESAFKSGEGKPLEFAYEISSKERKDAQLGYEYVAVSLIPTSTSDRMTQIASAVTQKLAERVEPTKEVLLAKEVEAPKPDNGKKGK